MMSIIENEIEDSDARAHADAHARVDDLEQMTDRGLTIRQALAFQHLAEHFSNEAARARDLLATLPVTPICIEMRAACAYRLKVLHGQGDALALLLKKRFAAVTEGFTSAALSALARFTAPPPRPAAAARAGRALAALTLTPRLLAQRPQSARAIRAG